MSQQEVQMIKAAWYYYIDNLTQQEIAETLGLSRMKIVKLLEQARTSGAVQFIIRPEILADRFSLEARLKKYFNLKDVSIAPAPSRSERINENIAQAAALYLGQRISANCLINIGYGDTMSRTLNHLSGAQEEPFSCVSLTGGVNYYLGTNQGYGHTPTTYLIPAPLIASTSEIASALKNEIAVKEICDMFSFAKFTVIGIGAMDDEATVLKNKIIQTSDFLRLKMSGAVGDILCHYYDAEGQPIDAAFENRLISPSLETIKELDNVIGVAAGPTKVPAIRAALDASIIDILITDETTALALCPKEGMTDE